MVVESGAFLVVWMLAGVVAFVVGIVAVRNVRRRLTDHATVAATSTVRVLAPRTASSSSRESVMTTPEVLAG